MTSAYVLASLDDLGIDHRTGFWGAEPERGTGGQLIQVVRNGDIRPIGVVNAMTCPVRRFTAREVQDSELRIGDVLVTTSGEPGKAAYWGGPQGFAASNFVRRLRAPHATIGKYVFYFLRSQPSKEAFARHSRGVAIKNLSRQFWDELRVPVRGVGDMAETVAAIESFFTLLDHVVASLERVQAKLKAYRSSVLKAAVEGRLVPTEASLARAEKRDYEPADALLARILKERRHRWEEAELAKLKAAGKTPKDDEWKAKYEEPAAPDTSTLPELPEGWCWASVDQLTDGARNSGYGVLVPGPDVADGVPLVRVGDIRDGTVSTNELKRIDRVIADQFAKTYLSGGEILLTLVGTIGRSALVPASLSGANVARAVGVIPASSLVRSRWVEMWFRSPRIQALMNSRAHEVARKTLNLEDVRSAAVAVPPVDEQERIVAEAEALESVAAATASTVVASSVRCARLRQAVLKWAFEGKLVDQEPTDEPAERLLARIRTERSADGPPKKKSGSRRAKGAA